MSETNKVPIVRLNPKDGQPFVTKKACEDHIKRQALDVKGFTARKWQGGWAAIADEEPAGPKAAPEAAVNQTDDSEPKYYWVMFQNKSNPNELEDVQLCLRGVWLIFQRGVKVPVPRRFLTECVGHAIHQTYTNGPNGPRQAGKVQLYPHTVIAPATEEEFRGFMGEARRVRDADYARRGLEVPDQVAIPD